MQDTIKVWSDGACHPNPGKGGWGWHDSNGSQGNGGMQKTTNNQMEMIAILEALKTYPDDTKVIVYSDSQYCVKGLTIWRKGWQKKNWLKNGAPMPNRGLWLQLEEQIKRLNVSFVWVRGHNGDAGNEKADALARAGRDGLSLSGQFPVSVSKPSVKVNPVTPISSLETPEILVIQVLEQKVLELESRIKEMEITLLGSVL